jgi:hypothetical protein
VREIAEECKETFLSEMDRGAFFLDIGPLIYVGGLCYSFYFFSKSGASFVCANIFQNDLISQYSD